MMAMSRAPGGPQNTVLCKLLCGRHPVSREACHLDLTQLLALMLACILCLERCAGQLCFLRDICSAANNAICSTPDCASVPTACGPRNVVCISAFQTKESSRLGLAGRQGFRAGMKVERLPVSGSWSRELADRWGHASLSSLRTVGTTLANGLRAGYDSLTVETTDKEALQVVKFACLEYGTGRHLVSRRVLLLGYQTGFQVWNLEEGTHARELASRRDGAVRYHVNPGLRRPAGYLSSASLLYVQGYDGWRNCLFGGLDGAVAFRSSSLLLAETALCALEHKFRDLDQVLGSCACPSPGHFNELHLVSRTAMHSYSTSAACQPCTGHCV